MSSAPAPITTPTKPGSDDDDLIHTVCRVCEKSLCGAAVDPNEPWTDEDTDQDCVVCIDLDQVWECVRCGAEPPP